MKKYGFNKNNLVRFSYKPWGYNDDEEVSYKIVARKKEKGENLYLLSNIEDLDNTILKINVRNEPRKDNWIQEERIVLHIKELYGLQTSPFLEIDDNISKNNESYSELLTELIDIE